jgi:hypothetical protein
MENKDQNAVELIDRIAEAIMSMSRDAMIDSVYKTDLPMDGLGRYVETVLEREGEQVAEAVKQRIVGILTHLILDEMSDTLKKNVNAWIKANETANKRFLNEVVLGTTNVN